MRHHEAIRTLRAALEPGAHGAPPPEAMRVSAEHHVSACSDCWRTFSIMYEAMTGVPPAPAGSVEDTFGCAAVQERLDQLVGLTPDRMGRSYPDAARHLGWCGPCRSRFAALVEIEAATSARPEVPVRPLAPPSLSRLLVRVHDGLVSLMEVSASLLPMPFTPLAAVRGPRQEREGERPRLRVSFQESGVAGTIDVDADGDRTARLTIRLDQPMGRSVRLRSRDGSRLGSERAPRTGEVVFRQVPLGCYVVEIAHEDDIVSFEVDLRGPEGAA